MISILILTIFTLLRPTSSQDGPYTLGNNILVNPDFEMPSIGRDRLYIDYWKGINGWNCSRYCQIVSLPYACLYQNGRYCPLASNNQVLDTTSDTV